MLNLVPLLAAAALVSLHSASDALLTNKLDTDNTLRPNVGVPARTRRFLRKYVKISKPLPETTPLFPGQRLEIECEVMGSPTPSVSWLKNGEPILDYEEEANEISSVDPSSITRLTSRLVLPGASDGDVFTCFATSNLNQDSASTMIVSDEGEDTESLLKKLLSPPKPIITLFYHHVFQESGTNIVLPCRIAGTAQLHWLYNDNNILYDNARMRVLQSGDLLIQGLVWSDMGEYTCVALNEFGKDTATTFLYPVIPEKTS